MRFCFCFFCFFCININESKYEKMVLIKCLIRLGYRGGEIYIYMYVWGGGRGEVCFLKKERRNKMG